MLSRKEAVHCRKHVVKTDEHLKKIRDALKGRIISEDHRKKISEKRRNMAKHPRRPLTRVCEYCNQTFTVTKETSKTRFCSRECGYDQRRGERAKNWMPDRPTITCVICQTSIQLPSRSLKLTRKTCSYTCKNILQRKNQRTKSTDIELAMQAALDRHGIEYVAQYGIARIATVDFYLPSINSIIFCDGDYWHSLPIHIERDIRQTKLLTELGYTVHRFLGSEILRNVDLCVQRVQEESSSNTSGKPPSHPISTNLRVYSPD